MAAADEPSLCFVEMIEAMKKKEKQLENVIVASLAEPAVATPLIKDIYLCIQNQCHPTAQPTNITAFPPDFILQFKTPQQRNIVLSRQTIEGSYFKLKLSPWTNQYRSNTIPWNTKVTVTVEGVRPQAFDRDCLTPFLSPHCDVQAYKFDESTGICTVDGFARNVGSIPSHRLLGLYHGSGSDVHTFPIKLHPRLYSGHEDPASSKHANSYTADHRPNQEAPNNFSSLEDPELFEDPDMVAEAFEEQIRAQKELENADRYNCSSTDSGDDYDQFRS